MEGSEVGTMDGETQIRRTLGSSENSRRSGLNGVSVGAGGQIKTLRTRLIAATVEVLAEGSGPRLGGTGNTRTAA